MNNAIGVFDSGVGGLSVLSEIRAQLPNENIIYVADSLFAPYGNKPREFIEKRSNAIGDFLVTQKVKALVVACNTATAVAAEMLRSRFAPLPVIAMEPGIKPAVAATRSGVIGVLATENTLTSEKFKKLVDEFAADKTVLIKPCYGLVELIERGELNSPQTKALLEKYIQPLLSAGADTLVLGCTHYPFVRELIAAVAGSNVTLIETGGAVAKHLRKRLADENLLNHQIHAGTAQFWSSAQASAPLIEQLWGSSTPVQLLPNDYL